MRYVVELIQTDPADSPSPGLSHYAGEHRVEAGGPDVAIAYGRNLLGELVPQDEFYPCCDWQSRETPVAGFVVYEADDEWNIADEPVWSQHRVAVAERVQDVRRSTGGQEGLHVAGRRTRLVSVRVRHTKHEGERTWRLVVTWRRSS